MWQFIGTRRPPFAKSPGPDQESVWDYPRPPALEASSRLVEVRDGEQQLARSERAMRVLETASPPSWYIPAEDVNTDLLVAAEGSSICEWKGTARYWALAARPEEGPVAWSYPSPSEPFEALRDAISFYPGRVQCSVDGEAARPQPGGFYGGWLTDDVVGPVKGGPGTGHW